MSTETQDLTQQVEDLRGRVEQLAHEIEGLKGGGTNRSLSPVVEKDRAEEVLNPDLFRPPGLIPGSDQDAQPIVGGDLTNDFPDCCAVGPDSGFYCTGTLIAPNVVVTAKHCINVTRVYLRGSNANSPQTGDVIRVARAIQHPDFDLQVLVLEQNSTVTPRHIAQGHEVGNPKVATIVGFGTTNFAGNVGYGRKRKASVPITSLSCSGSASNEFGCNPGVELVAGHRGLRRDTCKGDSGGPLYIQNSDGAFFLLGVTSRGIINSDLVCGNGGIYIRVDKFVDWIRQETGVDIPGPLN